MGTVKELKVLVDALRRDVDTYKNIPATGPEINTDMEQFRLEYENKLKDIKEGYESKITVLENKLNLVMKTRSETTLECIKGWIGSLDEKIDKITIELDIVKNNGINQDEANKNSFISVIH